jgi:hypothetical protein
VKEWDSKEAECERSGMQKKWNTKELEYKRTGM